MPGKKSTPVAGNLVKSTTKTTGDVLVKANKAVGKVPIVGKAKNVAVKGVVEANKLVNKIPVFGALKQKVTKGIGAIADAVPVVKNAKKGFEQAVEPKKKSKSKK